LAFEAMADDVAALIRHLGLAQADVAGYSLGGGVALQTAIRHREVVRRLVIISSACRRDGWYAESLAGMAAMDASVAEALKGTPIYAAYAAVAPRPEDFPTLVTKMGNLLRQDFDWSAQVTTITAPTLYIIGDADSVRPAHALELFGLLGGGR